MKVLRICAAIAFVAIPVLGTASPAPAALTGTCTATGRINGRGPTYNSKTVNKVVIPRKGDVHWTGTVPGAGRRAISGHVHLDLPWPIPDYDLGTWGKSSDTHANANVYHYDLPSVLAGIEMPVSGSHKETGVRCAGVVVVRIEGGGIKNPAVIGAFAVLIISGIGIWVSLRPKAV
jgi:hypothetical protein